MSWQTVVLILGIWWGIVVLWVGTSFAANHKYEIDKRAELTRDA